MIRMRLKADLSKVDYLERVMKERVTNVCQDIAQALVDDIKDSWSNTSPSSPGNPPAVVTGELDSSVHAASQGRDEKGRFASSENAAVWFLQVDAEYAAVLEYGYDRAFVAPAVERARGNLPFFFKDIYKL